MVPASLGKEKCELTNAEISRYSRQLILPQFGAPGQLNLRDGRVLIIGCGGLGCPAAIYLAAAGVGTIGLVDDDVVELNNLHRQVAHAETTVGKPKVTSLAKRCRDYDVIMDCSDNLATRYLINDACAVCGPKPLVSGSALRLEGQMTVYLASRVRTHDEVETSVILPASERAPCFRCLYPEPPPASTVQGCSEAGVFGVVPGIIGTMQAAEVIKLLTGVGTVHSGKLLVVDLERNLTRTVHLRHPRPDCKACGTDKPLDADAIRRMDYVLFCGAPDCDKAPSVNQQCLRNRVTVQQLRDWIKDGKPHVLIDLRPEVQVQLCRLTPCLYLPSHTLLRDSVLREIHTAIDDRLKKSTEKQIPVVLLCHRGNSSLAFAGPLASALLVSRQRASKIAVTETENTTHIPPNGDTAIPEDADFIVCDVAGGLSAWSEEVDTNFPTY